MAMTCCEADMTFLGFVTKAREAKDLQTKQWVKGPGQDRLRILEETMRAKALCSMRSLSSRRSPSGTWYSFNKKTDSEDFCFSLMK